MTIPTDTILRTIVRALREQVGPALNDKFAQDVVRIASGQLGLVANAWDNAAALRVQENAQIRALFAQSVSAIADNSLAEAIATAALTSDPGLRISELDGEGRRLRVLLIDLHAHVQTLDTAPARSVDRAIWQLLSEIDAGRAPRDQIAGQ